MKPLLSIPLRVMLPVLLLSCAAAAGLISWKLNARSLGSEIESQFLEEARLRITGLQATMEYLFRKGDSTGVDLQVTGLATRNDVIAAFVLDHQNRILGTTRVTTIGKAAEAIEADLAEDLKSRHMAQIAQVRSSPNGSMALSQDRRFAVAYYPLLVDVDDHALRSSRNGILVAVFDMRIAKARAVQAVGRQALNQALVFGGLAAAAWTFLHLSLTRRVAGLVATTRQLAAGDLTARTGITGSDELGHVAEAIDLMAGRIAKDLLQRKQAETELRESEERFQQLAENIQHVFWMATPSGDKLIYLSPAYERLWGRTRASAYADPQTWLAAVLAEDQPKLLAALLRNANGETYDIEYRVTRPDGSLHWMHDRGFPVRDEDGKVVRVCGLVEDITARKQTSEELAKTHKQLLEISRQAGMAEVATGVLHNVGNVLNSVNVSVTVLADQLRKSKAPNLTRICDLLKPHAGRLGEFFTADRQGQQVPGFLELLAGQLKTEQAAMLGEVQSVAKNVEHIKDIVAMQQSYAKVSGVTETLQVSELLEDSLRMNIESLTRHGVEVVREFEDVPAIAVDKHKVLQVLVNLVRNARHACDDSGRTDKRITLGVARDGECVRISVSDNGVGIPAENLDRIFNHGFTTKKDGHGFGLHSGALAAKEMGGSLSVHSDGVSRGSTFTMNLPLQPPSQEDFTSSPSGPLAA